MLRFLLFPFAFLYLLVTWARNRLYDLGIKPSVSFDIPVIGVGNLTVGGTGKTPMVEYLILLLREKYKIATLSRGYGRSTKGFRIASEDDHAGTIGDEPLQFYQKFKPEVIVSVGEDRAFAIPTLLQEHQEVEMILLDDAFQHRRVKPSFNVLLSDYNRPFYKDFLLPVGRLRESRRGAKRADAVVVTKCPPQITGDEMIRIEKAIRRYVKKPVFFASIGYGHPVPFKTTTSMPTDKVLLLTGIADPRPLKKYVSQHFGLEEHLTYADHYKYDLKDVQTLKEKIAGKPGVCLLTTEKDKVKLDVPKFESITSTLPLFYLPISIKFLKNGRDFDEMVLNHFHREE